jgi:hypothetical protein
MGKLTYLEPRMSARVHGFQRLDSVRSIRGVMSR